MKEDVQRLYNELIIYGRMRNNVHYKKIALMISLVNYVGLNTRELSKLMVKPLLVVDKRTDKHFITVCDDDLPRNYQDQIRVLVGKDGNIKKSWKAEEQLRKSITKCKIDMRPVSGAYFLQIDSIISEILKEEHPEIMKSGHIINRGCMHHKIEKNPKLLLFKQTTFSGIAKWFTSTLKKLTKIKWNISIMDFYAHTQHLKANNRKYITTPEDDYYELKDFKFVVPYFPVREQMQIKKKHKDFMTEYANLGISEIKYHTKKRDRSRSSSQTTRSDVWTAITNTNKFCTEKELKDIQINVQPVMEPTPPTSKGEFTKVDRKITVQNEDQGNMLPPEPLDFQKENDNFSCNSRESLLDDLSREDEPATLKTFKPKMLDNCLQQLCHFSGFIYNMKNPLDKVSVLQFLHTNNDKLYGKFKDFSGELYAWSKKIEAFTIPDLSLPKNAVMEILESSALLKRHFDNYHLELIKFDVNDNKNNPTFGLFDFFSHRFVKYIVKSANTDNYIPFMRQKKPNHKKNHKSKRKCVSKANKPSTNPGYHNTNSLPNIDTPEQTPVQPERMVISREMISTKHVQAKKKVSKIMNNPKSKAKDVKITCKAEPKQAQSKLIQNVLGKNLKPEKNMDKYMTPVLESTGRKSPKSQKSNPSNSVCSSSWLVSGFEVDSAEPSDNSITKRIHEEVINNFSSVKLDDNKAEPKCSEMPTGKIHNLTEYDSRKTVEMDGHESDSSDNDKDGNNDGSISEHSELQTQYFSDPLAFIIKHNKGNLLCRRAVFMLCKRFGSFNTTIENHIYNIEAKREEIKTTYVALFLAIQPLLRDPEFVREAEKNTKEFWEMLKADPDNEYIMISLLLFAASCTNDTVLHENHMVPEQAVESVKHILKLSTRYSPEDVNIDEDYAMVIGTIATTNLNNIILLIGLLNTKGSNIAKDRTPVEFLILHGNHGELQHAFIELNNQINYYVPELNKQTGEEIVGYELCRVLLDNLCPVRRYVDDYEKAYFKCTKTDHTLVEARHEIPIPENLYES
jgi:hypothetical protein